MDERTSKKSIRKYYWISFSLNWLPLGILLFTFGGLEGEAQLGYFFGIIWGLVCTIFYGFYLLIPEFKKKWEKIGGLLFPTLLLSLGIFQMKYLAILVATNLVLNLIFVWHFINIENKKNNEQQNKMGRPRRRRR